MNVHEEVGAGYRRVGRRPAAGVPSPRFRLCRVKVCAYSQKKISCNVLIVEGGRGAQQTNDQRRQRTRHTLFFRLMYS